MGNFSVAWFSSICRQESMSFHLGKETVTTKNDGAIGIQHDKGPWMLNGIPRGLRTVVSIEVRSILLPADFRRNEKQLMMCGPSGDKYSAKCLAKSVILNIILPIQVIPWK